MLKRSTQTVILGRTQSCRYRYSQPSLGREGKIYRRETLLLGSKTNKQICLLLLDTLVIGFCSILLISAPQNSIDDYGFPAVCCVSISLQGLTYFPYFVDLNLNTYTLYVFILPLSLLYFFCIYAVEKKIFLKLPWTSVKESDWIEFDWKQEKRRQVGGIRSWCFIR